VADDIFQYAHAVEREFQVENKLSHDIFQYAHAVEREFLVEKKPAGDIFLYAGLDRLVRVPCRAMWVSYGIRQMETGAATCAKTPAQT
jgi:hypothetical protein